MLSAKIVFDDRYGAYFSSEGIPSIPSGSSPGCRKFNGSKGSSTRDGFLSTWVRDRFSGACSCSPRRSLIFWSSAITQHLRRHVARRSCPRSSCSLRGPCATGHRAGSPGRPGDPETRNIDTGTYHPVFFVSLANRKGSKNPYFLGWRSMPLCTRGYWHGRKSGTGIFRLPGEGARRGDGMSKISRNKSGKVE